MRASQSQHRISLIYRSGARDEAEEFHDLRVIKHKVEHVRLVGLYRFILFLCHSSCWLWLALLNIQHFLLYALFHHHHHHHSEDFEMATVINGTTMIPTFNGTLIPKHDCNLSICSMKYAQLLYIPSKAGNAVYLAIFAILFLAHTGLGWRYRTWGFMIGLVCGLLLEVIGYAGRVMLHDNVFSFGSFVT